MSTGATSRTRNPFLGGAAPKPLGPVLLRTDPAWNTRGEWHLRYYGLTPEGIDVELDVEPGSGLSIELTDQADGLPELPGLVYAPRTPAMMPFAVAQEYMPHPETNSVSKRFDLP
jgi:hypothetical protein